eukprot:scaffold7349_cov173-Amphora_coffeaeformis.AAC.31
MEHNDPLHHHHHDLLPGTGDEEALIAAAMDAADGKHDEDLVDHNDDDDHHHLLEPLPFEPVHEIHPDNHHHIHNDNDVEVNHPERYSLTGSDVSGSNRKDVEMTLPGTTQPATAKDPSEAEQEPAMWDVLSGRGATVNEDISYGGIAQKTAHVGNKRFRSLCFSRKAEFEAANLAGT